MAHAVPPHPVRPDVFATATCVTAGFSRRTGGVSEGPYRSLNLGLSGADDPHRVRENRRRLFDAVDISPDRLAVAGQVHGSEILTVTEPGLYPGYDGLVTREGNIALCITAADCAAVLLADPDADVVGACHSGWRGTVAEISTRTVERMVACGARAAAIRAYVSPCISFEHFEVGPEVAARFSAEFVGGRADWPRPHVDLKSAIAGQLRRAGLSTASIEVAPQCTFAETETFFSYRAEHGTTGRMMGFVCLHT